MKRLTLTFALLMGVSANVFEQARVAAEALFVPPPARLDTTHDGHTLTPEMYRYLVDLQRYGGPVDLTRERARLKAQQRLDRINAMKWYGMSNSRPYAGAVPFMGTYSPRWTSNTPNADLWRDQMHYRAIQAAQADESLRR